MKRHATLITATLLLGLSACDKSDSAEKPQAAEKQSAKATEATEAAEPAEPATKTEPEATKTAPTVASGLSLDQRFAAFEIINCESGDEYCQVCKYGPSPKIMAVGTIDDPAFKEDLKRIDALLAKVGDDKVKAFAVIAPSKDGKLVTPLEGKAELQAKAKALKAELGVSFPIVIPAPDGDAKNEVFEDHYQVTASRTIMFADGRNKVHYSQVAPADLHELEGAIQSVLGS